MTGNMKKRMIVLFTLSVLMAFLLAVHPYFRSGMLYLFNRLFDVSEARNAYEYDRFAGADDKAFIPSLILLTASGLTLIMVISILNRYAAGLCIMGAAVLGEAYFGVSLPAWGNVGIFVICAILMLRQRNIRQCLYILSGAALISLLICLFIPGEHAWVERRSEQVRDWLGRTAFEQTADTYTGPAEQMETRHVNEKSIDTGTKEARGTEGIRLVQIEKMQIARPDWLNLLKMAGLFLGIILLLVLPFAPFVLLNMRRKQAILAREAFSSEDNAQAVHAMFHHVIRYLSAAGKQERNVPYSRWQLDGMPETYCRLYRQSVNIWEKAVYSDNPPQETERDMIKTLLDETEHLLYDMADRKQRFRLSIVECLHE